MKRYTSLILTFFFFFSCVPQDDSSGDFAIALKWAGVNNSEQWDTYLRKALEDHGDDLMNTVPNDITEFANNYQGMTYDERLNFWAYLISIMAEKESSFRPETSYTESFTDSTGNFVVSRGLLQLSIESARGYDCPVSVAEDLHDPELNLICAVKIMRRWVINDGVISGQQASGKWIGGARYWSVLRKENTLNFFKEHTLERF